MSNYYRADFGEYSPGQALSSKVTDAHASYVPADFTMAPTKSFDGIDHSDRWGYGEWPALDVEPVEEMHYWNGRPVTKRAPRTVVARPDPYAQPLGRPLTHAIPVHDPDATFANWVNMLGVNPTSRPPSSRTGPQREAHRIIPTDNRVDFLALPSRPVTQANPGESASPQFGAPLPPQRPNTRGLLKDPRRPPASPIVRNLSVTFAASEGTPGTYKYRGGETQRDHEREREKERKGPSYDRLHLDRGAVDGHMLPPTSTSNTSSPARLPPPRRGDAKSVDLGVTASSTKIGSTSAWSDWGNDTEGVSWWESGRRWGSARVGRD